ncbi:MAG TPA: hypothetical protein VMU11_01385, partial [Verrucomicrobiae bacterium]|nr:hypothetical protein [Verrucomicrobiae bacterium]
MPRKMNMKAEAESTPMERPGASAPDESGVRKKPKAPAEPSVLIDPEYLTEVEKKATSRYEEREKLMEEAADIKQRQKEMGGVWGGEAYFVEEDRLKEIEKALGIKRKPKKPEVAETGSVLVPSEKDLDALELKKLEKQRKDMEKERAAYLEKFSRYGMNDVASIEAELAELSPELREKVSGQKPGFGYRMRQFGRRLMGQELPLDVKVDLEKYHELENRINANTRAQAEVSNRNTRGGSIELSLAGRIYHPSRAKLEEQEVARPTRKQKQELKKQIAEVKEMKEELAPRVVWEAAADIEGAIKNLEAVGDDMEVLEDEADYAAKQNEFAARVRAMESQGSGKEYDEALQAAEDALARYAVALNRRLTRVRKQAAEAGPGEARPESVISMRAGRTGTYGTGREARRTVELSRMEKPETRERLPVETVNRDVEMYRTVEWRKKIIDIVNADEAWRTFMHSAYEDATARLRQIEEAGFDMKQFNSPDPALDYVLDLFVAHAQGAKADYTESARATAREGIKRIDQMLDWGERYKVKEEEATEPAVAEQKEVTLSVAEAQANFDRVNQELEAVGVTSLSDKMNDKLWLKADGDLRHAKRAARMKAGQESRQRYWEAKPAPQVEATLVEETPDEQASDEAEREAEAGVPSLQELIALAKSGDNDQQLSALENATKAPPSEEAPVMIEEAPAKKSAKKGRVISLKKKGK